MQYDLIIRFDMLAHIVSRLDWEKDNLSASPGDCLVSPQGATAGFPEVFNGSLMALDADKDALTDSVDALSVGVRTVSSLFSATEEKVVSSARSMISGGQQV